jgi:NTE family protein
MTPRHDGRTRGTGRRRRRSRGRAALVCAGGGVTGALYEIGALRALEELLDIRPHEFDLYVGVSGGAFVTSLLAHGIPPAEIYSEATSARGGGLGRGSAPLYRLGLGEVVARAARAPRLLAGALRRALVESDTELGPLAPSMLDLLPAGLLDNSGIRDYLARLFRSRGFEDRFHDLSRELYVVAVDLDSGREIVFGEEGCSSLPISLAVQASTALPGLYRPVRIEGRDYVDGGVKKTAHINRAISHGADLVVCINPLVPILNEPGSGPLGGHLSDRGLTDVLDQAMRIMLHGRMQYGLERYALENPDVDIILIEPQRSDMKMFRYNIMHTGARRTVAEYGYRSTIAQVAAREASLRRTLRRHGIALRRLDGLPRSPRPRPDGSRLGRTLGSSLDALDSKLQRSDLSSGTPAATRRATRGSDSGG